ncbi:hypothetical protein PINS_up021073 [Pythium insidiosum]|nr:hypothetical protein PINS_up021073 [Pythium insidiosum]
MLLLNRQKTVWLRDRPLLWGKLFEALVVGLVLGVIYFDCDPKYYLRMMFFSIAVFPASGVAADCDRVPASSGVLQAALA